jgi:hypothetical protein
MVPGERHRAVAAAAIAIVEDQAPADEGGAGRAGNLDAFGDIGARIVVVDLVDERRAGRGRSIVVDDGAGGGGIAERGAAVGSERVIENVSFGSETVSPSMRTVIVFDVSPSAKLTVPESG